MSWAPTVVHAAAHVPPGLNHSLSLTAVLHPSAVWPLAVHIASEATVHVQVVFVTTEVAPWSKAGGLGDVMAALPAALAAK